MRDNAVGVPVSQFDIGRDCTVDFLRVSPSNGRFQGEVYAIVCGGKKFYIQMMKLNRRRSSDPWVFGYIEDALTGKTVWSFPSDPFKIENNFFGDVYTVAGDDGLTYVEYSQARTGKLCRRILFSELLGVPQPVVMALSQNTPVEELLSIPTQPPLIVEVVAPSLEVLSFPVPLVVEPIVSVMTSRPPQTVAPLNRALMRDRSPEMFWFVREVLTNMLPVPEYLRLNK
jgi:hypothetical protein